MNDSLLTGLRQHDPIDLMGTAWCLRCHGRWPCAEGLRLQREAEQAHDSEECTPCDGLGDCGRCGGDGCGADPPYDGYCADGTCTHCAGTGIKPSEAGSP